MLGIPLSAADAQVFEQFVVPRYLAFFGALAVDMMIPAEAAVVANVGCRTGYPDGVIAERAPGATLMGIDRSPAALDIARSKASLISDLHATYQLSEGLPSSLPPEQFTHAMTIHPLCTADQRRALLAELRRILLPGGQALVALPLRGSFPEINDMIREFALRADLPELGKAIDLAAASRPTIETISEELETAGLADVDVDVQLIAVSFSSGKEFLEDPIASLMVLPDTRAVLGQEPPNVDGSIKYVHEAISKYWSEGVFELTVNVGCASGRRAM